MDTGATIAFDAIGGGKLAGQILTCMEAALNKTAKEYSRYGSTTHKQVYIYGGLDTGPTEFNRSFGMAWGIGGWLLSPFLQSIGPHAAQALKQRVAAELKTTFASHYTQRDLAGRGAAARCDRRLRQARDGREVPDQSEQGRAVSPLLEDVRHNPLLWLLVFVPVVFAAAKLKPEAHTLLFVLSVLAIVPLAALLSHATESVAAKTGDAAGGLLNATLGNLTELVIALTALRAGQYMLVKASIAGAIVTNTLFMLGASFLLGGLKHHVQEYNRVSARMQAGLLFLATVALLVPSAVAGADSATRQRHSPSS